MKVAKEATQHVHFVESTQSDTLLIAFAGNAGLYGGLPTFEFSSIMQDIPVKKLFLRDPATMWYQKGIPGIGQTIDEVARWLHLFVSSHNVRRIVTVGNSGGGYAALVFGTLLQATEVHAFVPQARLTQIEDSHKPGRIQKIHNDPDCNCQYLNVRDLLLNRKSANRPNMKIYYCTDDPIDVRHVQRLQDIDKIDTFGFNHGGHGLIRILKQKGVLFNLLQASLLGDGHGKPVTRHLVTRLNTLHYVQLPFRLLTEKLRPVADQVRSLF